MRNGAPPDTNRQVSLGELFDEQTVGLIVAELNSQQPELHRRLVGLLEPHRQRLLEQGLLVEYLAYYLESLLVE